MPANLKPHLAKLAKDLQGMSTPFSNVSNLCNVSHRNISFLSTMTAALSARGGGDFPRWQNLLKV